MSEVATSSPAHEPLEAGELARIDAYWRAANYLSVGQIYLLDNPLLREPLRARARQAAAARALGDHPRPQLHLRAHEPGDQAARPERDLHDRPGARRSGTGRQHLPGGHLQRDLPAHRPRRRGHAAAVPPVLLSRRHTQPRGAGDARVDPRGRRARATRWSTPTAPPSTTPICSSCCVIGDGEAETGPAGGQLALQQVPEPRQGRCGASDPAPQRLQDRQPHGARAHPARGAAAPCSRDTATSPLFVEGDDPPRCTS